jgi:hypothetical protein
VRPIGYTSADAELRIFAGHLKASTGSEAQRLAECTGIRDSMNAMPAGTHAVMAGDMNFYTQAAEPGYGKLIESQTNNIGRCYDMLPAGSWHDNASFAPYHTQSPCTSTGACASGGATGGMDDRFDMILPTYNLVTGQGLSAIVGTMKPVGNDGLHLNKAITDAPTIPEGAAYATALQYASDHLPVRVDFQVPARISVASSLDFGSVIIGATAGQNLSVSNPATTPADSLNCTFSAPAGFGAPGPLAVAAGASAPANVTMSTDVVGAKSGFLTITSDAVDNPSTLVTVYGTVLAHAQPSLDSLTVLLADTLDFGNRGKVSFDNAVIKIFNQGYSSLQARLAVNNGVFTGGGGHFWIMGGFVNALVADTPANYTIHFDTSGVTLDSTYYATLTFTNADSTLPGAQPRSDLVVTLRARPIRTQNPAKIAAVSQLDFGSVIIGATADQALSISNAIVPPGDTLFYSFGAPAGFSAPPGTFALAAGDPSVNQTIGMGTGSAGAKSGTLVIDSNDPDSLVKSVLLSGLVLRHAAASLDSLVEVTDAVLDFGDVAAFHDVTLLAAVHDLGYDALQARLSLTSAEIRGPDSRFTLLGFSPGTLVAGTAARFGVKFSAGGVAGVIDPDTLVFHSSDETLPGATAQGDVRYLLAGNVPTAGVDQAPPTVTRLYKPVPNPLLSSSMLRFDLAQGTSARLEIYDLTGRRVALLANREFAPGRYSLRWDGRNDAGAPSGPGLYYVRLTGRGLSPQTVRLAMVH